MIACQEKNGGQQAFQVKQRHLPLAWNLVYFFHFVFLEPLQLLIADAGWRYKQNLSLDRTRL